MAHYKSLGSTLYFSPTQRLVLWFQSPLETSTVCLDQLQVNPICIQYSFPVQILVFYGVDSFFILFISYYIITLLCFLFHHYLSSFPLFQFGSEDILFFIILYFSLSFSFIQELNNEFPPCVSHCVYSQRT